MSRSQPALHNAWRDPWNEINRELEPELRALGIQHYEVRDGTQRFLTLGQRCLKALAELRELRERSRGEQWTR